MVKLARIWKSVPEQQRCEINAPPLDKLVHHLLSDTKSHR